MQYLVSIGKQKEYIISLFSGAGVNFICNLILIPKLASVGAIIASFIGECTIVLVQIIFIRRDVDLVKLFKKSKNYIIASVAMLLMIPFLRNMNPTILSTIIVGLIGGVIYCTVLFLEKDEFVYGILEKLKKSY